MSSWMAATKEFFRGPDLRGNAKRTYYFHLGYAVLDAAAGGIVLNAPFVAIKAFAAANWHLPLRELLSGVGMIATLYLGGWMASRRKMPFVFIPGMAAGVSSLMMAAAAGNAFWFLILSGVGALFEIVTRPAITAIVRVNYSVELRGHATGQVRKWSSLAFMVSSVTSALILQLTAHYASAEVVTASGQSEEHLLHWSTLHTAQVLMILAGMLSLASFICFSQIRVDEHSEKQRHDLRPEVAATFREALGVVARDGRYRRHLFGCFLDGFCQMLYLPLIYAFLSRDLGFDYVGGSALMHAVPALAAFVMTGALGRFFDGANPWISWAWVRFATGADAFILAATPFFAVLFPPALVILPVFGRTLRGGVQGGWWIMWWQIGVTHFAPPGEDTSRYMGVMVFLYGAIRLSASAAGMALTAMAVPPRDLLVVGGAGVALSGVYSLWQAARERREHRPETMAEFESQFSETRR